MKGMSVGAVIKSSFSRFGAIYGLILGSSVLCLGSIFGLMLFPLFGFFLAYFAMGFLCVGQKCYVLSLLNKKKQPIESIFYKFRHLVSAFAMKTLIFLYSVLWGLLLFVPGVICALNYSFTSFVMADDNLDAVKCLEKSKKLVEGFRLKIFILFLFSVLIVMLGASLGFGIRELINLIITLPTWANITFVAIGAMLSMFLFAIPFYEISMAEVYLEAKALYVENKPKRKRVVASNVWQKLLFWLKIMSAKCRAKRGVPTGTKFYGVKFTSLTWSAVWKILKI